MNLEHEGNGLKSVLSEWQDQKTAIADIPLEEMRSKMEKFSEKITWRNIIEIGAGILVIVLFMRSALNASSAWSFVMFLSIVLGAVSIIATLVTRGWMQKAPPWGASTSECVAHQRKQIQRQVDLLSRARYWYVLPLGVGLMGLYLEMIYRAFETGSAIGMLVVSAQAILTLAFLVFVVWLNERYGVRKLKAMLELLPAE